MDEIAVFAGNPLFTAVQMFPLSVDKNTPSFVPAKMFVPLTAKERIMVSVKPLLTAAQLLPLLEDTYTPPPQVPAKIFVPLIANDKTVVLVNPVLTAVQL